MDAEKAGRTGVTALDTGSPEKIYAYVTDGVRDVIHAMDERAEDAEDEGVRSQIVSGLSRMQAHVAEKQKELQDTAEWKEFTVALYGETNAGKSTIIESLRIHLGEPAKVEQRRRFQELKAIHGLDDHTLQSARDAIEAARSAAAQASSRRQQLEFDGPVALQVLQQEKTQAEDLAIISRNARQWWKKLLDIFKSASKDVAGREIEARIVAERSRQQAELQALCAEASAAEAAISRAQDDLDERMRILPQLLEHADGGIIGDGRPDFTQATQRYTFNNDGTRFTLLDVPGIEGGEDGVMSHIEKAVRTAHAVFYVTGKAARPQHGDKEDGTLEKIKRHLGPQTEVWAVFNKRVTAPMPLRNAGDLFAHDTDGMADLQIGLREALGEHYKGVLPVSAYPAFLAVADHLPPEAALAGVLEVKQDRNAARTKFLSEFDAAALLDKTGFAAMANHLASMAIDAPRKIRHANVHKAQKILKDVVTEMEMHASHMESHARRVKKETCVAQGQVDMAAEQLGASLHTQASNALRAMEIQVRLEIYERIEKGIGNDDLKTALEQSLETNASELRNQADKAFKESISEFQTDITKTAERFQKHLQDLDQIAGSQVREVSGPTISLGLRVDNGVNVVGLVMTAIGAIVLAFSGPAGWVVITLSALGIVLSLAKALWGLIDEDIKKSQQRKAVNEGLSKTMASLKKDLTASEEKLLDVVKDACTEAKKRLGDPQRHVEAKAAVLRTSVDRLRVLSTQIEFTMA